MLDLNLLSHGRWDSLCSLFFSRQLDFAMDTKGFSLMNDKMTIALAWHVFGKIQIVPTGQCNTAVHAFDRSCSVGCGLHFL